MFKVTFTIMGTRLEVTIAAVSHAHAREVILRQYPEARGISAWRK